MSDDILNMSDEEFMKNYAGQDHTESVKEEETESEPEEKETNTDTEPEKEEETSEKEVESDSTDNKSEPEESSESNKVEPEDNEVKSKNKTKETNSATIADSNDTEPDYKALYQKIMAPFKADGKTVQLKNVNEAIALMQKGVNYTRKTQNLAKYQKSILSLEKANLLDARKLNNMINIYKGDKEAIKQLLAERKIDPMDLSSGNGYDDEDGTNPNYVPENNLVDDQEVNFRSALDEVKDTPAGNAVIRDLLDSDNKTKAEVYDDPRIIGLLVQHKENGIYDQVMAEVNRRRMIGLIDNSVPMIYAYNQVGNEMRAQLSQMQGKNTNAAGSIRNPSGSAVNAPAQSNQRRMQPKHSFTNNARARAAATNRTSPAADRQVRNPLSMSDEEFMKTYGGRY